VVIAPNTPSQVLFFEIFGLNLVLPKAFPDKILLITKFDDLPTNNAPLSV